MIIFINYILFVGSLALAFKYDVVSKQLVAMATTRILSNDKIE